MKGLKQNKKMLETAYVSTGDVFKYQCIDINSGKCLKRYIDLGTGNPLSKPAWKLVYKNVHYINGSLR